MNLIANPDIIPANVSPFMELFEQDVRTLCSDLNDVEQALIVAIGYTDYSKHKKETICANAAMSQNPVDDRNVTQVFQRYIQPKERERFADFARARLDTYAQGYATSRISTHATQEIDKATVTIGAKAAEVLGELRKELKPTIGKKVREHLYAAFTVGLVGLLLSLSYFVLSEEGADAKTCRAAVWLLNHSGHQAEAKTVNCS